MRWASTTIPCRVACTLLRPHCLTMRPPPTHLRRLGLECRTWSWRRVLAMFANPNAPEAGGFEKGVLDKEELQFLKRALHLDPKQRWTVKALLDHDEFIKRTRWAFPVCWTFETCLSLHVLHTRWLVVCVKGDR